MKPVLLAGCLIVSLPLTAGGHALYYRSDSTSAAPLVNGLVLLTLIPVSVAGRAQSSSRVVVTRLSRWQASRNAGDEQDDGPYVSAAGARRDIRSTVS